MLNVFAPRVTFVADERSVLDALPVRTNPSDIWSSVLSLDNAIVDAATEWTSLQTTAYNYDTWSSAANAMHWIASRPNFGTAVVPPPTTASPASCFGYPACAVAGAFGGSLDCCHTLPGCCPSDNSCCTSDVDPSAASPSSCHAQPACGVLGLSCCESPDGCCTPSPVTGLVLGCCKALPPPHDAATSTTLDNTTTTPAQCHGQPKCAAAGLACCDSPLGCCQPTASGQILGCCDLPSPSPDATKATCHNEPLCGRLGLECCGAPDGCCHDAPGQPQLECCSPPYTKNETPRKVVVGDSASTCDLNPRCWTAGPNGAALACCTDDTAGCCSGHACCNATTGWTFDRILLVALGVLAVLGVVYCSVLYLRRKDYRPLERDIRAWYCGGFMVVMLGVFFYLAFTVQN
ncbi:hypothetical protein DYB35_012732 [Aphanomyces astaci]|uniref:Uncharacterized protein n=1 Tax=Aphanomyces astaci TaxID=112090 RepID=A0A418DNH5_APHAT|nr:hypothetical protein DYB35_012732 [Aphanomyces astaci]